MAIFLKKMALNWPEKVLAFFLAWISFLALIYRFYRFGWLAILLAFLLSLAFVLILSHFGLFFNRLESDERLVIFFKKEPSFWLGLAFLSLSGVFYYLFAGQSVGAIISPWQVVSNNIFFFYYLLSSAVLFGLSKEPRLAFLFLAGSLYVIPLVYCLGFGYDFFVHEATMKMIAEQGLILPKTNFYLGQYSLLLLFERLSGLPSFILHLWLVPLTASLLLPWLILRDNEVRQRLAGWLLLAILTFPFLTFTTPQNFGLLLLLGQVIILSRPSRNNFVLASFFLAANLVTHPLSAIPALGLFLLIILRYRGFLRRRIFVLASLTPLAVPALLIFSGAATWVGFSGLSGVFSANTFRLPGDYGLLLNFSYAYGFNLGFLILAIFSSLFFCCRNRLADFSANAGLSLGILAAAFVLRALYLPGVADYEQADYSRRLILASLLVLSPLLAESINSFWFKISRSEYFIRLPFIFFLAALLTVSFYLSYPRHDDYYNSRGLSVGRSDIEAVAFIDNQADGQPYAVLANQQVSAAALKLFGFAHYYQGNFYYPIPTANHLYDYYLEMVYERPNRQTAEKAMDFMGTELVFLVLNKYWHNFPKLLEEAKLSADYYRFFGQGETYVFVWRR